MEREAEYEDFNFDLSMLEDQDMATLDGDKKFEDVLNNDVNLLDTSWLNDVVSVGKHSSSLYRNDIEKYILQENLKYTTVNEQFSDTESLAGGSSTAPSPALSDVDKGFSFGVSDEELLKLSVKDLNCQVKDFPKEIIKKLKQKRRTLKNRGYAHSCRLKRLEEKSTLQRSKEDLEKNIKFLTHQLHKAKRVAEHYRMMWENSLKADQQMH